MTRRPPSDLNIVARYYARWSPHEDKRREIADDHKEMFAEAKAEGLNPKALRKAFAEQYRVENQTADQAEKRHETDSDVELYLSALARVREDEPEHDAETGEVTSSATTDGGQHENADRDSDPVKSWRRRQLDDEGTRTHDVEVRTRPANAVEEPGRSLASTNTPTESVEVISVPHSISAVTKGHIESAPLSEGVAAVSGGSANPPVASAAVTNITTLFRHNPATHFLTSKGLLRLHGCTNPEVCAGSHRALCGSCLRTSGEVA